jgi:hypothetical protein
MEWSGFILLCFLALWFLLCDYFVVLLFKRSAVHFCALFADNSRRYGTNLKENR